MKAPKDSQPTPVSTEIHQRAKRLERMRQKKTASPLTGLSAFGVIGWTVAVPTVAGAFLGRWLNQHYPQSFSWTLALIMAGLVLGIIYAWEWIAQAQKKVLEEEQQAEEKQDD